MYSHTNPCVSTCSAYLIRAHVLCGFFCTASAKDVWKIENGPYENEWVRLSSISSHIYSASSPSKRLALHTGGDLWLRKLTLLSDLWLGGSTVTLSLSPFLMLFPKKSPLRAQDKKDFLWFDGTSLI